jgi:hypothetical protein
MAQIFSLEVGVYTLDAIEPHKAQTHLSFKISSFNTLSKIENFKPKLKFKSNGYTSRSGIGNGSGSPNGSPNSTHS